MDWDDAYANAAYIQGGDTYPDKWAAAAAAFRNQAMCQLDIPYGDTRRQRFDLFHPNRAARGVLIFVHGGYWLRFDKSFWSHLAQGPLAEGWAVAMPSYDLCPDVRITEIGQQITRAIATIADRVPGPIRLAGHSAGGQLVARAAVPDSRSGWQTRLEHVVSISPVSDLAPLMNTAMNKDLCIDAPEASAESPAHLPRPNVPVTVWVGEDERPVFLDQARWLAEHWDAALVVEPARHHFDVVEALADPASPLLGACLAPS